MKFGLKHLGLKQNDCILLPEYICNVVIHPLDQLRIKYKYYPIKNDLTPNWEELGNMVDKTDKALLMVHYFGQPQNIEKFQQFCKEYNISLIEDNAHGHGGMVNGKMLGTFGDIGFSSPRKSLNIHSGGILWLKDKKFNIKSDILPYPVSTQQRIIKSLFNSYPSLKNSLKKVIKNRPKFEDPEAFKETPIPDYIIDKESKKTIEKTNWDELCKIHQDTYSKWQNFALENSLIPVYSKLNPETNPWCFPAYTKNQQEAIKWFDWGWVNNKIVFSWPSLPKDVLAKNDESLNRWKKLICFGIG